MYLKKNIIKVKINSLHILIDILFLNLWYSLQCFFTYSSGSASSSLGKYSIRLSWRWAKTSFLISLWFGVSMWFTPVPMTSPESTFWQAEWTEEAVLPVNHISHGCHMVVSCLVICLITRYQLHDAYLSQLHTKQIFKFWFRIFVNSCIYQLAELTSDNW